MLADETSSQRVARLSTEADETLRGFLRRTGMFAVLSEAGASSGPDSPPAGDGAYGTGEETARGRTRTPRDERPLRALAKEMKRLITEDKRRGLGV